MKIFIPWFRPHQTGRRLPDRRSSPQTARGDQIATMTANTYAACGCLIQIGVDGIACVLSSTAMRCPVGARALSLMARACKLVGLKGQLDNTGKDSTEPSMAMKIALESCRQLGVRRLPFMIGDSHAVLGV